MVPCAFSSAPKSVGTGRTVAAWRAASAWICVQPRYAYGETKSKWNVMTRGTWPPSVRVDELAATVDALGVAGAAAARRRNGGYRLGAVELLEVVHRELHAHRLAPAHGGRAAHRGPAHLAVGLPVRGRRDHALAVVRARDARDHLHVPLAR